MRVVRLFWLPRRPVPPEGTPERTEYDALQRGVRWDLGDGIRWNLLVSLVALFFIVVGSYVSEDPHSWGMLLLRVGAIVIIVGIVWREIIRQSSI
jgi:hypothetical protein